MHQLVPSMMSSSFFGLMVPAIIYFPVIYITYSLIKAFYRLTFHPLAGFPGPRLAAATRWYEVYFEVFLGGRFTQQIEALHKEYGPIIRTNPNELHIIDPSFYDRLYNFSPDIDRPWTTLDNIQNSQSFELHKKRRRAFDPYFSKSAVLNLENVVESNAEELTRHFYEARGTDKPLSVTLLTRCFTADIITQYLFAQPYGFLTRPEQSEAFFSANNSVFQALYMFRESRIMDFIFKTLQMVPQSLLPKGHIAHTLNPFVESVKERVQTALSKSRKEGSADGHRVLFEDYARLDLPPQDLTLRAEMDTALMFVTAGFETTAYTMETAIFHVLSNKSIQSRLREELTAACPDPLDIPRWTELEKLPYLTAVITESLRMSIGAMARLPRKNMKENMAYQQWVIPKGTLVGMSSRFIHFNEDIYPDPNSFDPERWLKGAESQKLQKEHLASFSRGARRCLGMHLAYAELYLALARIFLRFDMELYKTRRRDVDAVLDFFIPKPLEGGNGVRVLVN